MKRLILPLLLISMSAHAQQTVTSITNGNWFLPATWDCTCIPAMVDEVIIDHDVILDNNWLHTGIIEVNPGAQLVGNSPTRSLFLDGAEVWIGGTFDVAIVATDDSTEIFNDGTLDIFTFYMDTLSYLENTGTVIGIDSILIDGEIFNDIGASFTAVQVLNRGYVANQGDMIFNDFLNIGDMDNEGSLVCNDFANWDSGYFYNSGSVVVNLDFWNSEQFENDTSGIMVVEQDWLNADSVNNEAWFYNDGLVEVHQDWANSHEVEGYTGRFCVTLTTANTGDMIGTFDFCDLGYTGPVPKIDLNTGNINIGITWCVTACTTAVDDIEPLEHKFAVYPNPFTDYTIIELPGNFENIQLQLFDATGRITEAQYYLLNDHLKLDGSTLSEGLYLFRITAKGELIGSGKLMVQ